MVPGAVLPPGPGWTVTWAPLVGHHQFPEQAVAHPAARLRTVPAVVAWTETRIDVS
jgi:hypothetical protein